MKVRNGFVSNSSSSSFVVAFEKVPQNVEELRQMLFGEDAFFSEPYGDGGFPTEQVAETVWQDMQEATPLSPEQVVEEFSEGHMYELEGQYPEFPWGCGRLEPEEFQKKWSAYESKRHAVTGALARRFLNQHKGKVFYRFHYSDSDGSYFCALEHGGLFDRLPHQTISHH